MKQERPRVREAAAACVTAKTYFTPAETSNDSKGFMEPLKFFHQTHEASRRKKFTPLNLHVEEQLHPGPSHQHLYGTTGPETGALWNRCLNFG